MANEPGIRIPLIIQNQIIEEPRRRSPRKLNDRQIEELPRINEVD